MIPDLEVGDDEDLQQHGGFGRTLWTPGHTAGSQCVLLPDGTVLAGDALTEGILPLHSAEGPLFVEDPDASRSSIVAIASAATGKVNVAHRGWLDPRSLKNWQHGPDPARGRDSQARPHVSDSSRAGASAPWGCTTPHQTRSRPRPPRAIMRLRPYPAPWVQ